MKNRRQKSNVAKISLILEAGMVKKLLSAIPIATFNKHEWFLLNGTTGEVLIKQSHLISNRIIKVFEACQPPNLCNWWEKSEDRKTDYRKNL